MPLCLNRLLVVVTGTDPGERSPPTLAEIRRELTAYLLEERDMEDEYPRAIGRHFCKVFSIINDLAAAPLMVEELD